MATVDATDREIWRMSREENLIALAAAAPPAGGDDARKAAANASHEDTESNTMATLGFDEGFNGEHFANSHNRALIPVDVATINIDYKVWAYAYQCHLVEDNDGAPTAYGLNNPMNIFPPPHPHVQQNLQPQPLERLANAASPFEHFSINNPTNAFHWVGLFAMTQADARAAGVFVDTRPALRAGDPDPFDGVRDKFPVVQDRNQPAPGFYVSTTAQPADPTRALSDQQRYWDASTIPYAVLSPAWGAKRPVPVALGDFGLAIRNDTNSTCGFFFADTGAGGKVGECSRRLVRTLAADGFNEDFVTFLVFPQSGQGAPRLGQTDRVIDATVRAKIAMINKLSNPTELAMFLALGADMGRYVEYVNATSRTDRVVNSQLEQRLRQSVAVPVLNRTAALHQFGYLPTRPIIRNPGPF